MFLSCWPEKIVEQSCKWPVIWDTMMLMWCICNDVCILFYGMKQYVINNCLWIVYEVLDELHLTQSVALIQKGYWGRDHFVFVPSQWEGSFCILLHPANERKRNIVSGWVHIQNDPCHPKIRLSPWPLFLLVWQYISGIWQYISGMWQYISGMWWEMSNQTFDWLGWRQILTCLPGMMIKASYWSNLMHNSWAHLALEAIRGINGRPSSRNTPPRQHTTDQAGPDSAISSSYHEDTMTWKHSPDYWPFVRRNHCWQVVTPHKWVVIQNFDVFFVVGLKYVGVGVVHELRCLDA